MRGTGKEDEGLVGELMEKEERERMVRSGRDATTGARRERRTHLVKRVEISWGFDEVREDPRGGESVEEGRSDSLRRGRRKERRVSSRSRRVDGVREKTSSPD